MSTDPHSPTRTRRVVVLRTSRFLRTAVDAVRERWPGCDIRVVYQRGADADVRAAGVEPEPVLRIDAPRLTASAFLGTRAFRRVLAWHPDAVVLQWWNPRGDGHAAADRAALLLLAPRLVAVLDDGSVVPTTWAARARRPAVRFLRGTALIACVLAVAVATAPAYVWSTRRERRRLAGKA